MLPNAYYFATISASYTYNDCLPITFTDTKLFLSADVRDQSADFKALILGCLKINIRRKRKLLSRLILPPPLPLLSHLTPDWLLSRTECMQVG